MMRFLFGLAMLACWTNLGFAQTKEIQDQVEKQLKDLRTEDELFRQALATHPDVMVAQAKRQVAEAELAQVKLAVAQRVSKLKSELVIEESSFLAARTTLDRLLEMRKKGVIGEQDLLDAETKVQFSQAKLSQLKTELQDAMPAKNAPASHPDVLVATAKLQVAEAELAQTKLVIAQKISTLKSEIDAQKQKLAMYEAVYNEMQKRHQAGTAAKSELMPAQIQFLESRTTLSRLSSELKGMTNLTQSRAVQEFPVAPQSGLPIVTKNDPPHNKQVFIEYKPTPGSPVDKLKSVLDKKVKFEAKAHLAAEIIKSLKEKYGLDVMIRMPLLEKDGGFPIERITIAVNPGEMAFTTWLELIMDDLNYTFNERDIKFVVYVREYGLLITPEKQAPQDAVTLKEFARQVRAEKEKAKADSEAKKP